MSIIIAGIHTGIGKTVCSAILCQALGWDYWKPVQAGDPGNTDTMFVRRHIDNPRCTLHREAFRLALAASPHHAAAMEGRVITRQLLRLPSADRSVVVETAGGLMSPLADGFVNLDLILQLQMPVLLVTSAYLGSISHTLLAGEVLKSRGIATAGLVFSGRPDAVSRRYILGYTGLPPLLDIPFFNPLSPAAIRQFADTISPDLFNT